MENLIEGNMQTQPDVLIVFQCTVCGENDELLGVDETEITQINWIAVDVVENKVIFFFIATSIFDVTLYLFINIKKTNKYCWKIFDCFLTNILLA